MPAYRSPVRTTKDRKLIRGIYKTDIHQIILMEHLYEKGNHENGLGSYHIDGNEPVGKAGSQYGPQQAEYHIDAEYDNRQNQDTCKQPSAAPASAPIFAPISAPMSFLLSYFLDPRQLPCHMPVLKPSAISAVSVDPQHIILHIHRDSARRQGNGIGQGRPGSGALKSVLTGTRQGVISMWWTALCG